MNFFSAQRERTLGRCGWEKTQPTRPNSSLDFHADIYSSPWAFRPGWVSSRENDHLHILYDQCQQNQSVFLNLNLTGLWDFIIDNYEMGAVADAVSYAGKTGSSETH